MAQLFNPNDSTSNQASQTVPPNPPMQPPTTPPPFQGQMFRRKQRFPMRTRIVGVIMILLVVIALPAIIVLSRQQQTFQGSAHTPAPSVTASCQSSGVRLSSSYTISDVPNSATCQIKIIDSQNYLNGSYAYKLNAAPYSNSVDTHQSIIPPGVVTFSTKCSDGFSKTNQVGYSWTTPCIKLTSTPTPTIKITGTLTPTVTPSITPTAKITPTGTPSITPSPTACVTPGQVTNVKVTCANCTPTPKQ